MTERGPHNHDEGNNNQKTMTPVMIHEKCDRSMDGWMDDVMNESLYCRMEI
jgi:hypothetical protein